MNTHYSVSTHSRTKAAAFSTANFQLFTKSFNTQPREGGCLLLEILSAMPMIKVSTHSRAEAAAQVITKFSCLRVVSTHSRAEAAALNDEDLGHDEFVSTHSRAEAAAFHALMNLEEIKVSTHSRAEAAACNMNKLIYLQTVSTHSRAEAAAFTIILSLVTMACFNTQPRGGGC